jgi:hypothetical protein
MFFVSCLIRPIFDAGHSHSLLLVGTLLSVRLVHDQPLYSLSAAVPSQGAAMGIGFGCIYLPVPPLVSVHSKKQYGEGDIRAPIEY